MNITDNNLCEIAIWMLPPSVKRIHSFKYMIDVIIGCIHMCENRFIFLICISNFPCDHFVLLYDKQRKMNIFLTISGLNTFRLDLNGLEKVK